MRILPIALFTVLSTSPAAYAAVDAEALHKTSCQSCHDDSVYQRSNRIVKSYGELDARVRFCDRNNHVGWNDEQNEAVVDYLNERYYTFKKPW